MRPDRDCARCGNERAEVRVRLPSYWVNYLNDQQGQSLSLRTTEVSVCHPCQYELEKLIEEADEQATDMGYPDDLRDEITTEFDGLDFE